MGSRPLLLALALTCPGLVRAQSAPAAPPAPCRVDTLGVDTLFDTLFAWIPGITPDETPAEHSFQLQQLRAVLGVLEPIPTLGKPEFPARYSRDFRLGSTPFDGATALVWFQVRADGRLAGLSVITWSGWSALDLALQRAVLRADSLRILHAVPPELAGEAVDLWLGVGPWKADAIADTAVARVRRIAPKLRGHQTRPRLLSSGYTPHFPDAGLRGGVGDELILDVIVDTAGHVVPDSIVFLRAGFREFAEEALKWVRSARFEPARVAGCPVRVHIQQAISFRFGRP